MTAPTTRHPLLDVVGLRVTYGGVVAVADVDLQVAEGSVYGLIGPNGAGKTSMVDALTGYTKPASGRIVFDGRDIGALRPYRRARLGLARTFQSGEAFSDPTRAHNPSLGPPPGEGGLGHLGLRPGGRGRPLPVADLTRQAQAGRHRPGAGPPAPAGPARRARGGCRHRRGQRAGGAGAGPRSG